MEPTGGVDVDISTYAEPGAGYSTPNSTPTTGTTVVAWLPGGGPEERSEPLPTIDGLRLWKPLDNALSAIDLNTGRRLWTIPIGETREQIRSHPLLAGVEIPNSGGAGYSIQMVTGSLLIQTRAHSSGESQVVPDAPLELHARDKQTGEILASVPLPAPGQYGMMTYMHEGKQYIVVQIGSVHTDFPGSLVALALP
jgi:quinoprotein glucose dehydrogenase